MPMQFSKDELRKAFDSILARWPDHIPLEGKTYHVNGGVQIRTLNEIHDTVAESLSADPIDGDAAEAIEWPIFTAVHMASKTLKHIDKEQIDFDSVLSILDDNPSYEVK